MSVSVSSFVSSEQAPTSSLSSSSSGSGSAASAQSSLNTNFQTFLTLLTTQLKNQDPTSPQDPSQFTSELAQMTGVQQQILSNQYLQQLVSAQSSGVPNAVDLIGKNVTADISTANLTNSSATWNYNLPSAASNATVTVTNSSGQTVFFGTAPSFNSGSNNFTWNGLSTAGAQEPDGVYTLKVTAVDSTGASITPTLSVSGVASSVQSVNGTTMVTIGSTQVPVSAIANVANTGS
jgi:flagellar basal-body rod modification protein FlgD